MAGKYGGKRTQDLIVEMITTTFGGAASKTNVDDKLKATYPQYKNNTSSNFRAITVNVNRGDWGYNRESRRTDDLTHEHHHYDRLFKRGNLYEIYDPALHGVFEIYHSPDARWLTRPVKSEFDLQVDDAIELSSEKRREKLFKANTTPERVIVSTYAFQRNPLVVAEVLALAGGKCQSCLSDAPFKREDGRPYLEVHHIEWLANGGEDSVENAIALCPNCHRQAHFGKLVLKPMNKVITRSA